MHDRAGPREGVDLGALSDLCTQPSGRFAVECRPA